MTPISRLAAAAVAATFIAACSGSPTAPTASSPIAPADAGARAPADTQKVTVTFYSDDDRMGGNIHLTGLPVAITAFPSGRVFSMAAGKQGTVSFWTAKADTSIAVQTSGWRTYCGVDVVLALPLHLREGWLLLHDECGP